MHGGEIGDPGRLRDLREGRRRAAALIAIVALVGLATVACSSGRAERPADRSIGPSTVPVSGSGEAPAFPTAVFAGLGEEPVSEELAAELQDVLEQSAHGDGLTATVISPAGTWSGATGFAAGHRMMVPNDQM